MASEINYQEIAEKLNQKIYDRNSYWFYGQIKAALPMLARFVKQYDIEEIKFEKIDMTIGKIEELVLDFLYELDPSFEENVMNVLEDLDHTVMYVSNPKEKAKGSFVSLRELHGKNGRILKNSPKVEIGLHPKNNTMGIVVVGHEYGHILSQRVQQRRNQRTDCIGEIEACFVERLFADWLLKKNKISKEERLKLDLAWRHSFLLSARVICEEVDLLARLKKNIKPENLRKIETTLQAEEKLKWLDILKHRIDVFINGANGKDIHGEHEFRYIVGEIVASALYEDFKKDSKKTIERFKTYLAHSAEYEFFKKKKVEKDGKIVEKIMFDKTECDKCFVALLGEEYETKLKTAIKNFEASFQKTKTA